MFSGLRDARVHDHSLRTLRDPLRALPKYSTVNVDYRVLTEAIETVTVIDMATLTFVDVDAMSGQGRDPIRQKEVIMTRRHRSRHPMLVIAGALVCLGLACCGSASSSAEVQKTLPGPVTAAAAPAYNIEQAISDRAQETTIAFDALGFLTGTLGSDSFFPPGKVADFWGFQYLRDNDPSEMGHNTDFLTSVSLNMLSVLTPAQRGQLIALATSQVDSINQYGYKRFVLMKAFRRLLEGDLPAGTTGLDEEAVKAYSAELYALDGEISCERAQVMGPDPGRTHAQSQRAYLDAMVGKGMSSWPKVNEPADLKGLTRDQKVAVMTYAGDMFSWYAGSLEADVYFCPERHGTYFGSFYLKDAPAVGNPGYSIDTTLTGNLGAALIQKLSSTPGRAHHRTGRYPAALPDRDRRRPRRGVD